MRITIVIRRPGWLGSVWLKRGRPLVLLLALVLASPVRADHGPFTDVPSTNPHHNDIELIRAAGITSGTTPTTYSPDAFVRRDQMASFLARVAGLGGNAAVTNADKLDGVDASGFLPADDYVVMQQGPWLAHSSSVVTIRYFEHVNTVNSAAAGSRAVQLALDGPASVGAIAYGFASARICFLQVDSNVTIDNTMVAQGSETGTTLLVNDDTNRSNGCYTVSDSTPTVPTGGTTLRLQFQYAAAAQAQLRSVTTTWTPVSP